MYESVKYDVLTGFTYCFQGSCDIHDLCYSKQGRSRIACDNEFHQNMKNQCKSENYPAGCWTLAALSYSAVRMYGRRYYKEAQKTSC